MIIVSSEFFVLNHSVSRVWLSSIVSNESDFLLKRNTFSHQSVFKDNYERVDIKLLTFESLIMSRWTLLVAPQHLLDVSFRILFNKEGRRTIKWVLLDKTTTMGIKWGSNFRHIMKLLMCSQNYFTLIDSTYLQHGKNWKRIYHNDVIIMPNRTIVSCYGFIYSNLVWIAVVKFYSSLNLIPIRFEFLFWDINMLLQWNKNKIYTVEFQFTFPTNCNVNEMK